MSFHIAVLTHHSDSNDSDCRYAASAVAAARALFFADITSCASLQIAVLTHHSDSDDSDDPVRRQAQQAARRKRTAEEGFRVTLHFAKLDRTLPTDSAARHGVRGLDVVARGGSVCV